MASSHESDRQDLSRPFLSVGATPMAMDAAVGPTELGKLLCATRMRLGKDLQHIAAVLHIRYTYLVAIEDGRYEDLPGQAYAIGFVRAYADHLGLDGDEIVRRYKEESVGLKRKAAFELPMPTSDSGLPSGTLLLIAVLAGMLIYGIWYAVAGSDRSAVELIQQVPDRLATLTDPSTLKGVLPVGTEEPPSSTEDATAEDTSVASAESADAAAAETVQEETASSEPDVVANAPPQTPSPATDVLELRAKADVWVTLRDEAAEERTQFLRKDEVLRVPPGSVTTLVTANASDLDILLNGKILPPLDAGLFAKGVVLDPRKLREAPAVVRAATTSSPPRQDAPTAKPQAPAPKTAETTTAKPDAAKPAATVEAEAAKPQAPETAASENIAKSAAPETGAQTEAASAPAASPRSETATSQAAPAAGGEPEASEATPPQADTTPAASTQPGAPASDSPAADDAAKTPPEEGAASAEAGADAAAADASPADEVDGDAADTEATPAADNPSSAGTAPSGPEKPAATPPAAAGQDPAPTTAATPS